MSDTELTVTIGGGGVEDARAVVRALEGTFGAPDRRPSGEEATVRTATFAGEGHSASGQTEAGPLSAPVTVTVQGTPWAVRRASDTLARSFTTRDEGAASGDQEQERQLLLEP
ncbi:hypothetical protein ACFTZ8_11770 [Streptomyces fungicidicus]|uniref:Uncharacterized protein n=1 Tax=Streptomyces fungicidicus TaxID=68203 RepID=A0A494V2U4_9ACTN|nr:MULTISPECIES: hypothetical protein [Streptomyces]AYL40067.1 hypothetical protein CNQ36_32005 [Streptomyces fungicidicus]TQL18614.1 hypothetical protein FBY37_0513 [Streptomyces sp. SLBN-134]